MWDKANTLRKSQESQLKLQMTQGRAHTTSLIIEKQMKQKSDTDKTVVLVACGEMTLKLITGNWFSKLLYNINVVNNIKEDTWELVTKLLFLYKREKYNTFI